MWEARREPVDRGERVSLLSGGTPLSFAGALEAMRRDEAFREFLLGELRRAPFPAFFWEAPPITLATVARPFEYVVLAAPALDLAATDGRPFASQITRAGADESVIAFPNLGGDALLIAPRCAGPADWYGHLAAFVRSAPAAQQHDLLTLTASQAQEALSDRPLWISTCGLGVLWLHVRLDSRPKYYSHAPYRRWPRAG
jgi:hypothetical protein